MNNGKYVVQITVYPMGRFDVSEYDISTTLNVYPDHSNPNYRTPAAAIKSQKEHYAKQGFYITWQVRPYPTTYPDWISSHRLYYVPALPGGNDA